MIDAAGIIATFVYRLKPKQPHPNPPLLPQGREPISASIKFLGLS
jgi:hypothetical protein